MSYIDDIIKWLTTPKTLKGLAGMTVIILILAADFAMWAGRDLSGSATGSSVEEEEEIDIPDDYDSGIITDSLPHGRHLVAFQQIIGDPRGEGEGETYNLYPVPILSNITGLEIVSGGDGGGSRIDGGDRNDIDIYLYAPEKNAGGDFDSTDPDYEGASPYIDEAITLKKKSLDLGNWTLRVDCYTGSDVSYTIQVQVFYGGQNATEEEP
jgi:hypothetical protein